MTTRRGPLIDVVRVRYRLAQGLTYLRPRRSAMLDARLRDLLRPDEFALVSRLGPADRAHHLAVHDRLLGLGCDDADLLKAALLHDVGKADEVVRVNLVDRTLAVLLSLISRDLVARLGSSTGARWRRGIHLTLAHPARGARLVRETGCSERVCWLIEHHHDDHVEDEGLKLLQRVDDGISA